MTTLRSLNAIAIPSVVCLSVCCLLSVVCLSVCLLSVVCRPWRWCTLLRRLNFSAIFFHHTIAQGLYFSGAKNRCLGTPLSPWNLRSKWPTPFQTAKFRQISAHSASTVIASEKSSISSTYRKSTTCNWTRGMQLANTPPLQSTTLGLHPVSIHQTSSPVRGSRHPIAAYYLFIDLERMKGWVA